MRILVLDQFSELGGAQQCLLDLLPAVGEQDWTLRAMLPAPGPFSERLAAAGVAVEQLPLGSYRSGRKPLREHGRFLSETVAAARSIQRALESFRPDLLYVAGPRLLPAAAIAARRRTPLLFHCQSRVSQPSAQWLMRRALRQADATVVACCRYAAEPIRSATSADRLQIVYNAARGPERPTRPPDGPPKIGLIGRISAEKGQLEFVRAARRLHAVIPEARFVVCGDVLFGDPAALAYAEQVRAEAAGLPMEFLGWRDDVYAVLAELSVVVAPSTQEPGTTRVILEAYSSNRPVAAAASGGIAEIVRDGETGVLFEPANPQALADALESLCRDPARRDRLAANAFQYWLERFTLSRYQREMVECLRRAAARAAGGDVG